jgi:hypothetical protein
MTNAKEELNLQELDGVTGGSLSGWLGAATAVGQIASVTSMAQHVESDSRVGTEACNNPAKYGPVSN